MQSGLKREIDITINVAVGLGKYSAIGNMIGRNYYIELVVEFDCFYK